RINLLEGESYIPGAWGVFCLGDHVLWIVFQLLERHREDSNGRPFSEVAEERLSEMDWGDQPYFRDHIYRLACRVSEVLETEDGEAPEPPDEEF
ncbi:MAG: hypothetical protein ACOYM3_27350, partial [Terrimicrobiaceae bacterium]